MTDTGPPVDALARERAEAVVEALRQRAFREVHHQHTREVSSEPPEILARLEALEAFARQASESVNRANADAVEARRELAEVRGQLEAIRASLKDFAPMRHYHDYQAGRVA